MVRKEKWERGRRGGGNNSKGGRVNGGREGDEGRREVVWRMEEQ